jgi:hypothetical protein
VALGNARKLVDRRPDQVLAVPVGQCIDTNDVRRGRVDGL